MLNEYNLTTKDGRKLHVFKSVSTGWHIHQRRSIRGGSEYWICEDQKTCGGVLREVYGINHPDFKAGDQS